MNHRNTIFTAVMAGAFLLTSSPASAGSLTGTVTFDGEAPKRREVKMNADPACAKANPDGRLGEVMVISDGKLANVFVYAKGGVPEKEYEVPSESASLDQLGCMYTPHVLGVMVGQTVAIKNSDSTLHNVHSMAKESKQFNSAMPLKNQVIKKKFTAPEVMARMKCDVHPWMSAYIGVMSHPFFAVTGEDGTFTISDLPAGEYEIEAWHERLGTKSGKVTVGDDGDATLDFSFAPAAKG